LLTQLLLAQSTKRPNPFSELYASISSRTAASPKDALNVLVFFPRAKSIAGAEGEGRRVEEGMELSVRKDASVEEVLGFALWTYWEEEWMPPLDSSLPPPPAGGPEEEKVEREREALLSALGWVLLIAEEDGEVDDDFPAPNRTGKVSTFNAEAFAVVEASEQQRRQNELVERGIVRRVSRIVGGKSGGAGAGGAAAAAAAVGGGVKKVAVNGAASQTALVGGTNGTTATGSSTATGTSPATGTAAKEGNITTVRLFLTFTYTIFMVYFFLICFFRQHNRRRAKTRTSTRTSPPPPQLGTCPCLCRLVGLLPVSLVSFLPSYPHFLPRLVSFLPHLPTQLTLALRSYPSPPRHLHPRRLRPPQHEPGPEQQPRSTRVLEGEGGRDGGRGAFQDDDSCVSQYFLSLCLSAPLCLLCLFLSAFMRFCVSALLPSFTLFFFFAHRSLTHTFIYFNLN
jgi:hypothetical protein